MQLAHGAVVVITSVAALLDVADQGMQVNILRKGLWRHCKDAIMQQRYAKPV